MAGTVDLLDPGLGTGQGSRSRPLAPIWPRSHSPPTVGPWLWAPTIGRSGSGTSPAAGNWSHEGPLEGGLFSVAFHPGGGRWAGLGGCGRESSISGICGRGDGRSPRLEGHRGKVWAVAFGPDPAMMASAGGGPRDPDLGTSRRSSRASNRPQISEGWDLGFQKPSSWGILVECVSARTERSRHGARGACGHAPPLGLLESEFGERYSDYRRPHLAAPAVPLPSRSGWVRHRATSYHARRAARSSSPRRWSCPARHRCWIRSNADPARSIPAELPHEVAPGMTAAIERGPSDAVQAAGRGCRLCQLECVGEPESVGRPQSHRMGPRVVGRGSEVRRTFPSR